MSDLDIGTISGTIELVDHFTSTLDVIRMRMGKAGETVERFGSVLDGAMKVAGVLTLGYGVERLANKIVDLGEKGSRIIGVKDAFDKLALSAGSTGDILLGKLEEGTKHTVDSFDLMQMANRALSAGLKITGADAEALGAAAREMGKAAGTDAESELQTLFRALTTGQTRLLKMKGVIVDVKGAEQEYAKANHTTADRLNQTGKIEAVRIGILEATRKKVEQLGISELTFAERIKQGQIAIGNWFDALGVAISKSPHISNAMDKIGDALKKNFGGTSQTLLEMIVGWINKLADYAAKYGPLVIEYVRKIWDGIKNVGATVAKYWDMVPDWFKNIAKDAALAGAGAWAVSKGLQVMTGSDTLSLMANLGTIISGTRDAVLSSIGPITRMGKALAELKAFNAAFGLEGVSTVLRSWPIVQAGQRLGGFLAGLGATEAAAASLAVTLGPLSVLVLGVGAAFLIISSQVNDFINQTKRLREANENIEEFEKRAKKGIPQTIEDFNKYNRSLQLRSGRVPLKRTEISNEADFKIDLDPLTLAGKAAPPPPNKDDDILTKLETADDVARKLQAALAALKVQAQGWAQYMGKDVLEKPTKEQEAYLGVLNQVIEKFGSLKAAGLEKLEPAYSAITLRAAESEAALMKSTIAQKLSAGGWNDLTLAQNKAVNSLKEAGLDTKEIASQLDLTEQQVSQSEAAWDKLEQTTKQATAEAIAGIEKLAKARGDAVIQNAQDTQRFTEQNAELGMTDMQRQIHQIEQVRDAQLAAYAVQYATFGTDIAAASIAATTFYNNQIKQITELNKVNLELVKNQTKVQHVTGLINSTLNDLGQYGSKAWQTFNRFVQQGVDLIGQYIIKTFMMKLATKTATIEAIGLEKAHQLQLEATAMAANIMWATVTLGISIAITAAFSLYNASKEAQAAAQGLKNEWTDLGYTLEDVYAIRAKFEGRPRGGGGSQSDIDAFNKALEDAKKISKDLDKQISALTDSLDVFGNKAPAEFQPFINALLASTKLTEDQRKQLEALQGPTPWKTLEEAAGRYDLALDQLGKSYQQLKLNDVFDQFHTDWIMFRDAGTDVNVAMTAMSKKVSEALIQAKKFGTDVPEYMRPMLESMLEAGQLIDENGNALKDLGGIKFSASIESSMDKIADILQKIYDLFVNINDLTAPAIDTPADPRFARPRTGAPSDMNLRHPAVEPRSTTTTVIWEVDGRKLASTVVPYIPDEVQRYKLTP